MIKCSTVHSAYQCCIVGENVHILISLSVSEQIVSELYLHRFLYARHLTDVLWYGAVRPSVRPYVRSVVHNPCGQDIARTIWPRMLKLSMYT